MPVLQVQPFRATASVGPQQRLQVVQQRRQQRVVVTAAAAVDVEALEAEALSSASPAALAAAAAAPVSRRKTSRRFAEQQAKVPAKETALPPLDAIKLALDTATAKFSETVEVHAKLNIDPKYTDQQLRATVSLPKGTGKFASVALTVQAHRTCRLLPPADPDPLPSPVQASRCGWRWCARARTRSWRGRRAPTTWAPRT